MVVVYSNCEESITCSESDESQIIEEYFGPGMDRDINEYTREVMKSVFCWVTSQIKIG